MYNCLKPIRDENRRRMPFGLFLAEQHASFMCARLFYLHSELNVNVHKAKKLFFGVRARSTLGALH